MIRFIMMPCPSVAEGPSYSPKIEYLDALITETQDTSICDLDWRGNGEV